MKTFKHYSNMALISALFMMTFFMGGCGSSSCDETSRPAIDVTQPYVMSTIPAKGAINVPLDQIISATLNEAFNPDTVNEDTFTVVDANGDLIPGVIGYSNNNTVMTFTPQVTLDYNTTYTATVTTGVTDVAGNALDISNELNVWSFTTVATEGVTTNLTVISTDPIDGATNVRRNKIISALLSEELNSATVGDLTFTLHNTNTLAPIEGNVTYDGNRTMSFDPLVPLVADTNYTATITTGVQGLTGNTLASDYVWTFRTGLNIVQGPEPVILDTAGDFAILTQAGITNLPTSAITGNIGTSPIAAVTIEVTCSEMAIGFSIYGRDDTYVDPTCYVNDPTLVDNAVVDMGYAYTDAYTRTPATGSNLNVDTGLLTSVTPDFAPGLYTWGSNVTITDNITLTGNADDIWIFQISGTLKVENNAIIILNGAQAKNIFWQVAGTNVTIGTNAQFSGIILAKELIAVQTGASVDGRLLAQTEVTLDQTVITQPAP